jgi:hypothetical protein
VFTVPLLSIGCLSSSTIPAFSSHVTIYVLFTHEIIQLWQSKLSA